MSDLLDKCAAEQEAAIILQDHPFPVLPICPFVIAKNVGILVHPKASTEGGVSGFLMHVGQTFGIQYAQHIPNDRFIRFTVAHELGHYFLPGHADFLFASGDGVHRSRSGFISGDRYERQADYFASALLMPEPQFRKEVNGAGSGFQAIERLAKLFQTSITATAIRYIQFTDDAVAVIVSSCRQIDYCFMSDRIRDLRGIAWIKKGDMLPAGTTTARFNRDPSNIQDASEADGTCSLDDWFEGAPGVEVNEDVVGLGNYGKTLTVLFTDEELEDEDEYEDDD